MANTQRITKVARFTQLLALDSVLAIEGMEGFIEHEIELLNRKSGSASLSASAKQTLVVSDIVRKGIECGDFEQGHAYTIAEFCEYIEARSEGRCSPQRANPMLLSLAEEGLMTKGKDGKVVKYTIC